MCLRDCEVEVYKVALLADLLPLELMEFDIILGINFLSRYQASIDCFKKEIKLVKPDGVEVVFRGKRKILPTCLVSAVKPRKWLSKGCEAYLAYVTEVKVEKLKLEDVLVV